MFGIFNKKLSEEEIERNLSDVETRCSIVSTYLLGIVNARKKISEELFFEPSIENIRKNLEFLSISIVNEKNLYSKINNSFRNLLILKETLKNEYNVLSSKKNLQEATENFNRDVETFKALCIDISNKVQDLKLKERSYLEKLKINFIQDQRKYA